MKKVHYLVLLVFVLTALGIIWYALEYADKPPVTSAPGVGTEVKIINFSYQPAELSVKVGETVTWTNEDVVRHTVTSDAGNELGSELLAKSETFSHTFTAVGEYPYYCVPHPNMKGKIIVSE